MTIVEDACVITGGVDTHADTHVAAALDPLGALLGVREFPATAAGYAGLLDWLAGFGTVALVGVEGTGSYGAGLARHLAAAGIRVVEVDRADRQDRHRQGKSDPLDAVSAARAALSGRASGAPKGRDGAVEAIRALTGDGRSARAERTQAINQARALILTGPDELRARFAGQRAGGLAEAVAALRPRPGDAADYSLRVALRELGRRVEFLNAQIQRLDDLIIPLVTARAPGLSASTASARTPPPCCSSPPGTARSGCAARPPGRTCAPSPRSPHPRGRPAGTASTAAATARPAMPCGGSSSPG